MSDAIDPPGEEDRLAYVDGQLDPARHAEIERLIAVDPHLAARIEADVRIRDQLRLLMNSAAHSADAPAPGERPWRSARAWKGLGTIAAAIAIAALGWVASDEWDLRTAAPANRLETAGATLPRIAVIRAERFPIDEAVMSHKTALMRAAIYSLDAQRLNTADIGRATRIILPKLPAGWRVLDVQLFPSDVGPSMQVTLDDGPGPPISLFAVRARTSAPQQPEAVAYAGESVAYWQEGALAYALTGAEPLAEIDRAAEDLADNALDGV